MATTGAMNGTDLLLYKDGVAVAHTRSADLTVNGEMIDVTTKGSGGWKDVIPGLKDWGFECDGVVNYSATEGFSQGFADITNGTSLVVKFGTEVTGDVRYTGTAYVSNLKQSAPMEDVVTYSFSLAGTGVLSEETVT